MGQTVLGVPTTHVIGKLEYADPAPKDWVEPEGPIGLAGGGGRLRRLIRPGGCLWGGSSAAAFHDPPQNDKSLARINAR
jgi:hypothetical protein